MEGDKPPTREVHILSRPMGSNTVRLLQEIIQKAIEPNRNDLLDNAAVDYEESKKRPPLPKWYHHWAVRIGEGKAFHVQANTSAKKKAHGWPVFWEEVSSKDLNATHKIYLGRTTLTDEEIRVKADKAQSQMQTFYNLFNNNCQTFGKLHSKEILEELHNEEALEKNA